MSSAIAPAVAHLYRALLYLYPRPFRVEFGSEMVCDFEDAMSEALTMRGWIGVLVVWTFVAADLMRTIAIQWLRSGVPTVIAMAATWTISCCVLIAQGLPRRDASLLIPPRTADQEMQIMLLTSAVVVLLIAATVLLTGWFWMFVVKRRSRA